MNKYVLGNFLSSSFVLQHSPQQRKDAGGIAIVDGRQGLFVSGCNPTQKIRIVILGSVCPCFDKQALSVLLKQCDIKISRKKHLCRMPAKTESIRQKHCIYDLNHAV